MNYSRYSGVQSRRVFLIMRKHLYAEGLRTILKQNTTDDFHIQGQTARFNEFLKNAPVRERPTDILLLELYSSIDWLRLAQWKRHHPTTKIVGLTPKQDFVLWEKAKKADLDACLMMEESTENFLGKLNNALSGNYDWPGNLAQSSKKNSTEKARSFIHKYHLTPRELQVLKLITKALSTKQIASILFISDQTVSVHRKNIMRKLGVKNTAAVVRMAMENFIVD